MMTQPLSSTAKEGQPISAETIRVMVVDDSAIIRNLIARACDSQPNIKVIATASNGEQAVTTLKRHPVDVVVLDIEMPIMDGLAAIPQLKTVDPAVQIIMASTLTQKNADISLKAMALGAADYIPKPTSASELSTAEDFNRELVEKIIVLAAVARRSGVRRGQVIGKVPEKTSLLSKKFVLRNAPIPRPEILAIGSSTGGPQALFEVIRSMGPSLPQPIVITQHMPATFTAILAEHISKQCGVTCNEAKDGAKLEPGQYTLAAGDFHLLISKKSDGSYVRLTKDPQENFCRPAVDPMLRSLVEVYGKRVFVAILTGMGSDGYKGCQVVCNAGGAVIAQDEASSIVWGMPGAVAIGGLCSAVLPVKEIGPLMKQTALKAGS